MNPTGAAVRNEGHVGGGALRVQPEAVPVPLVHIRVEVHGAVWATVPCTRVVGMVVSWDLVNNGPWQLKAKGASAAVASCKFF